MKSGAFEDIAGNVRRLLPLAVVPPALPRSPVSALRWSGTPVPDVYLDGTWGPLQSVDGVAVERLIDAAVELGGRDWQRMMVAEFCTVAAAAGAQTNGDYLIGRSGMTPQRAPATARDLVTSVWYFLQCDGRVDAPDAQAAIADFGHLGEPSDQLSAAQVELDLTVLECLVQRDFAYWDHVPGKWAAQLERMRSTAAPIDRLTHVERMRDLMVLLGDGHTRVDSADRDLLRLGVLPFQIDWIDNAPVAVTASRGALLDPGHPFITAIAGIPISEWMRAARRAVPRGTAAMRRNWLARELRRVGAQAPLVGASVSALHTVVTLSDERGASSIAWPCDLITSDPKAAARPVDSRWLAGDVGYLALRGQMTSAADAIAGAHAAMREFASAKGLVIDIRDNGGGSRDLLRAVIGYLVAPGEAIVTSWARLRRGVGQDPARVEEVLRGRFMRPWNWSGWSPPARAAAAAFEAWHIPEWPGPEDERFGPLNLLIAERLPEHGEVVLDCPVTVLTNIRNYSASDIFASSLAAVPGVVLLGTPTAGGSGFARRSVLPGSFTTIQISTMASGMVSGDLYENHGVVPQELLWPTLEQWRQDLTGDPLVIRALERMACSRQQKN